MNDCIKFVFEKNLAKGGPVIDITFNKSKFSIPLVAVPSTYSRVYEKDLVKNGFKVVIYANHLLRAAYPAMNLVATKILENGRSFEIENKIIPIKEIINLIQND